MLGLLSNQIDRWLNFENALEHANHFIEESHTETLFPTVNLYEESDKYLAQFELPGFQKKDINVEVKDNKLRVHGQRRLDYPDKARAHQLERSAKAFNRTMKLEKALSSSKIEAEYEDGVLTITLPIKQSEKTKKF